MSTDTLNCGPFEVVEPIGSGGMGAVYRGRHREDGEDVAIKVMTVDEATDPSYLRAFRREAQALAKLHHPAIADIYDFGRVDASAAEHGPQPFREGAPWFAMEYVEGTSVGKLAGVWTWQELEQFLMSVLDSLSHAHARGVLHRDLTASNILVEAEGGPGSVKVVDFGLARLVRRLQESEADSDERSVRGTPRYMAPEQILGQWRNQGPWTDLYALGCLAWRIACGESPFEGEDTRETFLAHFEGPQGTFEPNFTVPDRFEAWVRGLLDQAPARRCRRAADAAWALLQLETPEPEDRESTVTSTWEGGAVPTLATVGDVDRAGEVLSSQSVPLHAPTVEEEVPAPERQIEREAWEGEPIAFTPPPLPAGWERENDGIAGEPMSGAGLELFGLRRLPFVDRTAERDRLWHALCRVHEEERCGAVLLTGPAGSGKTRLSEWLGERAHELGAATVLQARHRGGGGRHGGIGAGIVRHFRCEGLGWAEALERLTDQLESLGIDRRTGLTDAAGLLKLGGWGAAGDDSREIAGFRTPEERNAAVGRVLRALSHRERPLVVQVDDVAHDRDSLEIVDFALRDEEISEVPILFVLTARAAEWRESELLGRLVRETTEERCRVVEVGPLEDADQRELVRRMLRFDDEIVETVVDRTEGHPLFAVQLVRAWVDEGVLRERDGAFVLERERLEELPENLDRLWARRVEQLLERFPESRREEIRRALELAAVLGERVDNDEWRAASDAEHLEVDDRLLREMMTSGLVEEYQHGWEFQHGMLAESLVSSADRAGRLEQHHRVCASTLESLYAEAPEQVAERRAEHLIEAGDYERALEPMLRAARHLAHDRGHPARSTELLERRRRLMDACQVPNDDRRRAENWVEIAENAISQGEPDRAEEALNRARSIVDGDRAPAIVGIVHILCARLRKDHGGVEVSFEHLDRAEEIFRRIGDERRLARTLRLRGQFDRANRPADEIVDLLEEARTTFEDEGDVAGWMRCQKAIAWAWLESGHLDRAEEIAKELIAEARDHRERIVEAHAFNLLGELARRNEEWARAIRLYERSSELWKGAGSRYAVVAKVNLALAHAGAGRWSRVERLYGELEEELPESGFPNRLVHVHVGLASAAAAREDWERWERRMQDLREMLDSHEIRITDFPWMAELGAEECAEAGAVRRARRMLRVAAELWADIGNEEDRRRVERRLDGLSDSD